jgi:hypothetical protein
VGVVWRPKQLQQPFDTSQCEIAFSPTISTDPSPWILSYPRGAYSAARTVRQWNVMDFKVHVARLVHSFAGIYNTIQTTELKESSTQKIIHEVREAFGSEEVVTPWIRGLIGLGLLNYYNKNSDVDPHEETKVTILVCP